MTERSELVWAAAFGLVIEALLKKSPVHRTTLQRVLSGRDYGQLKSIPSAALYRCSNHGLELHGTAGS
jgi:hypothetical protein